MEKHHKFSIWYIFLGIWGVFIIHNMIFSAMSVKTIPYSEFLKLIKEGKVSEVAITQNQIQGRLIKNGSESGLDGQDSHKGNRRGLSKAGGANPLPFSRPPGRDT